MRGNHRTPLCTQEAPAPPSSPPPLAPRDAARVAVCASVPGRFAQSPKRCSALVPGCPPCCDRRASGSIRGSSATNLAQPDRGQSDHPARGRIASMPTALPRRPKQARTMRISFYESDARSPAVAPARSQIQNKVGRGVRRGYLRVGPQAAYTLRVGAAAPFLSMRPQRRSQSRGLPEHDVLCSQPREIVRDDARSLPRSV